MLQRVPVDRDQQITDSESWREQTLASGSQGRSLGCTIMKWGLRQEKRKVLTGSVL